MEMAVILTPVDDCREKGEESEVRWVLPEADVESQDLPDTMSGLAVKMSDLDRLSDRLRRKLGVIEGAPPAASYQLEADEAGPALAVLRWDEAGFWNKLRFYLPDVAPNTR